MSIAFNGSSGVMYVPTGDYAIFPRGGAWTISFWLKVSGNYNTASASHWIFHRSGAAIAHANTISYRITQSTNATVYLARDSDNAVLISNNYAPGGDWSLSGINGWNHFVFTKSRPLSENTTPTLADDVTHNRLYINNHLASTNSRTANNSVNLNPIILGRRGDSATNTTLSGSLAEFTIYDKVLTPDEINQLYNGHDPMFLSPVLYFPLNNDYIDRVYGITGLGIAINNVILNRDHPPVLTKGYYPGELSANLVPNILTRIGRLEQKGYVDFIDWIPGVITQSGTAQTGAFFRPAKLGEAYQISPNRSISGCIASAYVSQSGTLNMIVANLGGTVVNLFPEPIRWNIFRL